MLFKIIIFFLFSFLFLLFYFILFYFIFVLFSTFSGTHVRPCVQVATPLSRKIMLIIGATYVVGRIRMFANSEELDSDTIFN